MAPKLALPERLNETGVTRRIFNTAARWASQAWAIESIDLGKQMAPKLALPERLNETRCD